MSHENVRFSLMYDNCYSIQFMSNTDDNFHGFDFTTSVNVERSFCTYNNILSGNRLSFTTDDLTKYTVVNCFFLIQYHFSIFFLFDFIT